MRKILFIILLTFNILPFLNTTTNAQETSPSYQSLITLGDKEFNKGEYISAKSYYQEALRIKKDDSNAKNKLNKTLQKIKEQGEKEEVFYQYIDEADNHYNNGDYEKALASYNKARNLFPKDEYTLDRIKHINDFLKNEKDKLNNFNDLISIADNLKSQKKYPEALEKYEEALLDFNNALKMDNNNPIIYFNRGTVFLNMGDTIAALKDYEKVNKLDERNALTYFNRGIIYGQIKENDIALALFDKVIEINPKNIYGYFNRGILYYKMNELDNAENDFTKVIELFPDFIDAWVNRSVVRYEKGNIKDAESDRAKSKEIMDLLNSDDKNIDSLYNIYSKSIDYDKIIAFDSDFNNGDKGGKLAQYSSVDIKPFGNYIIGIEKFNAEKQKTKQHYVDATLSQINENKQLDGLRLVYMREDYFKNNRSYLNDSLIEMIDNAHLKTFLQGLSEYEIHNYQHAERNFYSLSDNNTYYIYATINIASLQKDKAELVLANQNYDDPVSINTKKKNDKKIIKNVIKPDYHQSMNTLIYLVEKNKTNPFIWYNLGNIHLQMQEFHKAIDDYTFAIKYEKNLAEAYYNRGLTLLFLGEKELANSDLSKAGELGIKEAYAVIKRFIND